MFRPIPFRFALSALVLAGAWLAATGRNANAAPCLPMSQAESQEILARLRTALCDQAGTYFSPKTHAWYSQRLDRLPPAADVKDLYPNPVGYGTGMDDCPLFAGALMVALVELYDMTHAECLRNEAFEVYQGLKLCGTAHGVPGFVARGICIEDGTSAYITSSRDQYTHYVDGLWQYYHSPLCSERSKGEIRRLLGVLADTMTEQIIEANDFGFLRADGSKDPRGLHKMWRVYAHEVARIAMIYAAAWDVGGDKEHYALYRRYLLPAIRESIELKNKPAGEVNAWVPPYSCFQMACSLALLYRLEEDPAVKADILEALIVARNLAAQKMPGAARRNRRELAEVLIAQLMIRQFGLDDEQKPYLCQALRLEGLAKGGPPTTIHLLALYAKACQSGLLPVPQQLSPETWASATGEREDAQPAPLFSVTKKPIIPERDEHLVVFLADPHVGAQAGEPQENLAQFQAFCDRIAAMRPRPAAVVLAGDLAFDQGTKDDYACLKHVLQKFDAAGIPWRACFGTTDRREAFFEVFPQCAGTTSQIPGRMVGVVETPRADFILLDTLQEGKAEGAIGDRQRQWLQEQLERYRQSGKRFFVVSHHPAAELDAASLVARAPTCVGWISGRDHMWKQDTESVPKQFHLQSTAYAPNAWTRRGFTYLKMDAWEFVFRPVSPDTNDLWERRIWVVRFPRPSEKTAGQ